MDCECGVQFIFRDHERTGKAAPIEAVPHPRGNIQILPGGRYRVLSKTQIAECDTQLYRNHYVDCPARGRRRAS